MLALQQFPSTQIEFLCIVHGLLLLRLHLRGLLKAHMSAKHYQKGRFQIKRHFSCLTLGQLVSLILLIILIIKSLACVFLIPSFSGQVIMPQEAGWGGVWLTGVVFLSLMDGSLNRNLANLGFCSPDNKNSLCVCMLRRVPRVDIAT